MASGGAHGREQRRRRRLAKLRAEKVALELAAMLGEEADGDELSSDDEA